MAVGRHAWLGTREGLKCWEQTLCSFFYIVLHILLAVADVIGKFEQW